MDSAPPGFVQGQNQCTEVADPFDRPQQRFFCTTGNVRTSTVTTPPSSSTSQSTIPNTNTSHLPTVSNVPIPLHFYPLMTYLAGQADEAPPFISWPCPRTGSVCYSWCVQYERVSRSSREGWSRGMRGKRFGLCVGPGWATSYLALFFVRYITVLRFYVLYDCVSWIKHEVVFPVMEDATAYDFCLLPSKQLPKTSNLDSLNSRLTW
jgi:hypothetical protein